MTRFSKLLLDYPTWFRQARHLMAAADVLAQELASSRGARRRFENELIHVSGCLKGTVLLLAVAVENALKAVKVARNEVVLVNGRVLRKSLGGGPNGHDLVVLSREINLDCSEYEHSLLQRLSTIAQWAGKYQQPLSEIESVAADTNNPRSITLPSDPQLAKALIARAESLARAAHGA